MWRMEETEKMRTRMKGWQGSFSLISSHPTNMVPQEPSFQVSVHSPHLFGSQPLLGLLCLVTEEDYYEDDEEDDPDALKDPIYQVDLQVRHLVKGIFAR